MKHGLIFKLQRWHFDIEEHLKHIVLLLEAISKESFRLKYRKFTFAFNSGGCLGKIIGNNTVQPLKENIISNQYFPTSTI